MRVVMLTMDVQIDRRILQEAETLIDEGHEVILLACAAEDHPRFELIGRVQVERLDPAHPGRPPHKPYRPFWLHAAAALPRLLLRALNIPSPSGRGAGGEGKPASPDQAALGARRGAGGEGVSQPVTTESGGGMPTSRGRQRLGAPGNVRPAAGRHVCCGAGMPHVARVGQHAQAPCTHGRRPAVLSLLFRIFGGRVEACHPKPEVILRPIQEGEVRPVSGVRQRIEAALRWIRDMAPRGLPWLSRQVRRLWSDPLCRWEQAFAWRIEFYQPDVLHVHDLPLLKVAVASQRALKVPLVFDAHELYSAQPRMTPARRARALKLEARYLPRADRTITVNPFLAREIESRHGLGPVAVVQNAIDAPELLAGQRYDLFRRDYGWSPSRILLLYHGWIAPERNLEIALRGMKAVRNPRYLLIFMGYGDYARELRQMADRAGLSDRVAFVPAKTQEELMPYVASADIGLVPYPYGRDLNTHFASPNKLYELIVAGVPILTNELPFVRDVVRQRQIGVSADIQSEPGFAAALDAFPLERLAEFKQNLLRCQAEFTWKTEGEKIKEIYREVTKG